MESDEHKFINIQVCGCHALAWHSCEVNLTSLCVYLLLLLNMPCFGDETAFEVGILGCN